MADDKLRRAKRKVNFESSSGSEFSDFDSDDDVKDKDYRVSESEGSTEGFTDISVSKVLRGLFPFSVKVFVFFKLNIKFYILPM